MDKKIKSQMALASMLAFASTANFMDGPKRNRCRSTIRDEKQCPVCGTKHDHNNSYCSAECCKKDR